MSNQELHLTLLELDFERVLDEHGDGQHGERGSENRHPAGEVLRKRILRSSARMRSHSPDRVQR